MKPFKLATFIFLIPALIGCNNNFSSKENVVEEKEIVNDISKPISFNDDSWGTVCAAANMGKTFFESDSGYKTTAESLIGNERKIDMGELGIKTARLIDVNHDSIVNQNKGLLTFQILEPFVVPCYGDSNNTWYKESGKTIIESTIRKYCNETIYNSLPEDLKNNIVASEKETIEYNSSFKETTHTLEKVFPFSLTELGSASKEGEGAKYQDIQIKKGKSYWTRSPSTKSNQYAWMVDEEGNTIQKEINTKDLNVYVGFTVGGTINSSVNLNLTNCTTDKGTKITGKSGETVSFTIKNVSGYKIPKVANFSSGIFDGSYNAATGVVTFTMPGIKDSTFSADGILCRTFSPSVSINSSSGEISYTGGATTAMVNAQKKSEVTGYTAWQSVQALHIYAPTDIYYDTGAIVGHYSSKIVDKVTGPTCGQEMVYKGIQIDKIINAGVDVTCYNSQTSDTEQVICSYSGYHPGCHTTTSASQIFVSDSCDIDFRATRQTRNPIYTYSFSSITWQEQVTKDGVSYHLISGQGTQQAQYEENV